MLDKITQRMINIYVDEIRKTMNSIIEEINGNFEGWCELGTMLLYRVIGDKYPEFKNEVFEGSFKNEGHFWNVINGVVVDTTIDQFGRYKVGIVNKKHLNNYKIKRKVNFRKEDLEHMTEDIYDFLYFV